MKKIAALIISLLCIISSAYATSMNDYCVRPPFQTTVAIPTVMMVLDYSGRMQPPAYLPCSATSFTASTVACGTWTSASSYQTTATPGTYASYQYATGTTYYGYFNPNATYSTGNQGFSVNSSTSTCTTNVTTSGNTAYMKGTSSSCISGNLLNWAAMTRMDVMKMVLNGGISSNSNTVTSSSGANVTFTDSTLGCKVTLTTTNSGTRQVLFNDVTSGSCPVGDWGNSNSAVSLASDSSYNTGIIQSFYGQVNFSFMLFGGGVTNQGDDSNSPGNMLIHLWDPSTSNTISMIGNQNAGGNSKIGEALWAAFDFYTQSSAGTWSGKQTGDDYTIGSGVSRASNQSDENSYEGGHDPFYYNGSTSGTSMACKNSYILLISDGNWNGQIDPIIPASYMNTHDARPDLSGTQRIKTYTVNVCLGGNCTASTSYGTNAMKAIAMFGAFNDSDANNYPYPVTGYSNSLSSTCSASPNQTRSNIIINGTTYCNSLVITWPISICDSSSSSTWNASCVEWDKNQVSYPYNYYSASSGSALTTAITNALNDMMKQANSGTSASVLSTGQGSGATLLQAAYYPERDFGSATIYWVGMMQNLWYYIDPMLSLSNIREDSNISTPPSTVDASDKYILNLKKDYIINYYFDTGTNQTMAYVYYDANGDGGTSQTSEGTITLENTSYLWEAGSKLWSRDVTTSPRRIYSPINTSVALTDPANTLTTNYNAACSYSATTPCTTNTLATWQNYLNVSSTAWSSSLIRWVNGEDLKICSNDNVTACTSNSDCSGSGTCQSGIYRSRTVSIGGVSGVWKLGDILNSTPRFVSWTPINNYHKSQTLGYGDTTYSDFTNNAYDATNNPAPYFNRGMAFVGANDGMLHAFNMGKISLTGTWLTDSKYMKAKLCTGRLSTGDCTTDSTYTGGLTTADFGKEMWAFIPKNALPYLQYLTSTSYCHLYYVDATPYIFDASVNIDSSTVTQPSACTTDNYYACTKTKYSWRTILIGSMRLGGSCTASTTGNSTAPCPNCVKSPTSNNTGVTVSGYSSYYALDITDPNNPTLLWEFNDPSLGFSTTGPALIRIGAKNNGNVDNTKNGRWLVVFGSGPTGYIDTTNHQFMGNSSQNLKLFIFDLKKGPTSSTTNDKVLAIDTGTTNAFAGSLYNSTMDLVNSSGIMDYQDDVLYFGYTEKDTTLNTWTNGGVMRLLVKNTIDPTYTNWSSTSSWAYSKILSSGGSQTIGPVTSAVAHIYDTINKKIWIYFGTGRYFYQTSSTTDDGTTQRKIYGFTDPCFSSSSSGFPSSLVCSSSTAVSESSLGSINLSSSSGTTNTSGWYILLPNSGERIITDPLASYSGDVYFTSFVPSSNTCSYGGSTYLWMLRYNTAAADATQQGKALLQTSTGTINQLSLQTSFTTNSGRTTASMLGMPPTGQGLSVITPPLPLKRLLHKIVQ